MNRKELLDDSWGKEGRHGEIEQKEKGLRDNSVVIARVGNIRWLNGNGKKYNLKIIKKKNQSLNLCTKSYCLSSTQRHLASISSSLFSTTSTFQSLLGYYQLLNIHTIISPILNCLPLTYFLKPATQFFVLFYSKPPQNYLYTRSAVSPHACSCPLQWRFHPHCTTKTTLVNITNDIYRVSLYGEVLVLILLIRSTL